jgi:tetratricopeptide (TPR) repeat protein
VNENSGYFWKVKGNEAFQKGRYNEAVELYSKAIVHIS